MVFILVLRKLTGFGILKRRAFPVILPRVEYHLTSFGYRFSSILQAVEKLQSELEQVKD